MMSKEPERMQRLADLGFDTSKAYLHGTPKVFEEFDPARTAFVSPDAKFSEMFSGNTGQTIPVFVKHEGIIDLSDRTALEELVNQLRQYPDKEKAQNAVDYINLIVEKPKNNWMAAKQLHPILKDLGYKGATETEFNSKNLALFNPSEQVKSVWAKGKGPGLIGGAAGAALLASPSESTAQEINPLNLLGSLVNKYRGAQEKAADYITEQVNPYKKQPADETAKGLGRMMFDPLNLVDGPIGHALMGIELMSNKKEKLP